MCKDCHSHGSCCACGCGGETHAPAVHGKKEEGGWRGWWPMAVSALLLLWGWAANPLPGVAWLIFVVAYLPVGVPVIREAAEALRGGDVFNEFTLMLLATAGAFAIGEYPEAVAVLLFYSVGEYFQDKAVGRARRDIRALVSLRPDTATVVRPDGVREVRRPEDVKPGEIVEVKAGGRVPLDGRLLTPRADFDTAALTGEPLPRPVAAGGEVQAGVVALGRVVQIEAVRPYGESALQRILTMVEDAAQRKSPAEQFVRRFARVYTPAVIVLAALVAVLPPLFGGGDWAEWLYRALVFLVISCPCALVVSIPLGYFRGIGVASRMGVLFKGGNYLDAITRVRTVVFDKTGTLTEGRFKVCRLAPAAGFTAEELLRTAAALERFSTHPLARAVVEAAEGAPLAECGGTEEIAGLGLRGSVAGKEVLAGKAELLAEVFKEAGISDVPNAPNDPEDAACTYIYIAVGGRYAGRIALRDTPKEDAAAAVARLRSLGIDRLCILSGDRTPVVESLARELGIGEAYGGLLPDGKARRLEEIRRGTPDGGVCFVGDGINDAPVLALSDVGVAMGGAGADAAVETADVVVQGDRPSRVADAIAVGRMTRRVVRQNIALALGVKAAVLLLGACGLAGLWAAVLADTGVALLCVAHTYRIAPSPARPK